MAFSIKQQRYKLAWIWHWPEFEFYLNVSSQAAETFDRNRQMKPREHERGGQLFLDLSCPDGVWLLASDAHEADKSGRTWLEMDPTRCRQEIQIANAGGLRLAGTWHTHPQDLPSPSYQDLSTLRAFSNNYIKELPNPIAVIVGRASASDGIRAWSFRPPSLLIAASLKAAISR